MKILKDDEGNNEDVTPQKWTDNLGRFVFFFSITLLKYIVFWQYFFENSTGNPKDSVTTKTVVRVLLKNYVFRKSRNIKQSRSKHKTD